MSVYHNAVLARSGAFAIRGAEGGQAGLAGGGMWGPGRGGLGREGGGGGGGGGEVKALRPKPKARRVCKLPGPFTGREGGRIPQ